MTYQMRNDYCLVRVRELGMIGGIAMPDSAIAGKEFEVEAVGPDVEDLEVGDKVLLRGAADSAGAPNYYPLPQDNKLIVIQEKYVVLIFKADDE